MTRVEKTEWRRRRCCRRWRQGGAVLGRSLCPSGEPSIDEVGHGCNQVEDKRRPSIPIAEEQQYRGYQQAATERHHVGELKRTIFPNQTMDDAHTGTAVSLRVVSRAISFSIE